MSMQRRSALSVLLGIAASALVRCRGGGSSRLGGDAKRLTDGEVKTLAAAAECIYPQTGTEDGARSLGIEQYLTKQLGTKYYRREVPTLRRAAASLDEAAMATRGRAFFECRAQEQDAIFEAFAQGKDTRDGGSAAKAFNLLVDITLEGCFSHPRHGGNAGMKAWKVMESALQKGWFIECDCAG